MPTAASCTAVAQPPRSGTAGTHVGDTCGSDMWWIVRCAAQLGAWHVTGMSFSCKWWQELENPGCLRPWLSAFMQMHCDLRSRLCPCLIAVECCMLSMQVKAADTSLFRVTLCPAEMQMQTGEKALWVRFCLPKFW